MTTPDKTTPLNLDDPQVRQFAGEYLDARREGILGQTWTASEYVQRRQREAMAASGSLFSDSQYFLGDDDQ